MEKYHEIIIGTLWRFTKPSGLVRHDVGMLISQALWNFIGGQEVAGLVAQHGSADIQHTNVLKPRTPRKENQWRKTDIHDIQIKRLANKDASDAKLPHAVLLLSRMHAARPLKLQSPSCPRLNSHQMSTISRSSRLQVEPWNFDNSAAKFRNTYNIVYLHNMYSFFQNEIISYS